MRQEQEPPLSLKRSLLLLRGQKLTKPDVRKIAEGTFERSPQGQLSGLGGGAHAGQRSMPAAQCAAARFSSRRAYCVSGKHMTKKISATSP